jgi:hypothetical protein
MAQAASPRPSGILPPGLRWTGIAAGLVTALSIAFSLIGATWRGWDFTFWAETFGVGPSGHLLAAQPPVPPPLIVVTGPSDVLVRGSPVATLLIAVAAALAGWLVTDRRVFSGATIVAGVALCGFGLADQQYSYREVRALLPSGSFSAAWAELNFNHVLIVLGVVLIIASFAVRPSATAPSPAPGPAPVPSAGRQLAGIVVGLVCIPVVGYLMAVTSPTILHDDGLWLPLRNGVPYDLVVLIFAVVLGVLASARRLPPSVALVAGAPIFALGVLMLVAPESAVHVVAALVPSADLRFEIGQLTAAGMPMLYGGLLLVTAASPSRWGSRAPAAAPELQAS